MIQATLRPAKRRSSCLHDIVVSKQIWKAFDQAAGTESSDTSGAGCEGDENRETLLNTGWQKVQLNKITLAIAATGRLCDDWNGYGAERPSASTREVMWRVLDISAKEGLVPDRVVPSAEGGLFMLFKGNAPNGTPLKADIESFNSGEVTFAYRPKDGELTIWEVAAVDTSAIEESVQRLRGLFA